MTSSGELTVDFASFVFRGTLRAIPSVVVRMAAACSYLARTRVCIGEFGNIGFSSCNGNVRIVFSRFPVYSFDFILLYLYS